ncbi:MAG: prepilin-type N-terminal cleavage/methylation domain-containing protein [Candidatus Uhrbacteria bacterium]|nr:prepilin-type N-terminal cleavage/methylation domain-containing protein [Candidatus Uhrbacteria bacterium]
MKSRYSRGFTLIELLVVIAIIGLLATFSVVQFANAREKARDAKRLSEIKQIRTALEMYKDRYGAYPNATDGDDASGGYDIGCIGGPSGTDTFISELRTSGILQKTICDPRGTTNANSYMYYRYAAGSSGCDVARGAFYVLIIMTLESTTTPSPTSPGWSCPSRDWSTAGGAGLGYTPAWVTGAFEN